MYKKEIAKEYGISVVTLNKWLKRLKKLGKPVGKHFTQKQLLIIQQEYGGFKNGSG